MTEGIPDNPGSLDWQENKPEKIEGNESQEKSPDNSPEKENNKIETSPENLSAEFAIANQEIIELQAQYGKANRELAAMMDNLNIDNVLTNKTEIYAKEREAFDLKNKIDGTEQSVRDIRLRIYGENSERTLTPLTAAEIAEASSRMEDFAKKEPDLQREGQAETIKVEQMMKDFEATHHLELLHAITELEPNLHALMKKGEAATEEYKESMFALMLPESIEAYKIRSAAKADLGKIDLCIRSMQTEMKIPDETVKELRVKYKLLSYAVGMVDGAGKIDHTR